jgi:hypothetical protein
MDSSSRLQIRNPVLVVLALGCVVSCQSVSQRRADAEHFRHPGGFIREVVSNSVLVAEYKTGSDDVVDVREYRLDDHMPAAVFVDKNHDGRPDLFLKQESSSGMIEMMMSDTDFDGRYDTFAIPNVLTLKDVDGDGWPDEYWKGYRRPTTASDKTEGTGGPGGGPGGPGTSLKMKVDEGR